MFLEKITWKQAEGYFKEKDIAIIPVGSTENHAPSSAWARIS